MKKIIISLCFVFTFLIVGIGILCINSNAITANTTNYYHINSNNDYDGNVYNMDFYAKNWNTYNNSFSFNLFSRNFSLTESNFNTMGLITDTSSYNFWISWEECAAFYYYLDLNTYNNMYYDVVTYDYHTISLFFTGFNDYYDDNEYYSNINDLNQNLAILVAPVYYNQNPSQSYSNLGSNILILGDYWDDYIYNVSSNQYGMSNLFEVCFNIDYGPNTSIIGYNIYVLWKEYFSTNNYSSIGVGLIPSNNISIGINSSDVASSAYNNGYNYGYTIGNSNGYNNGYDIGYEEGYDVGYDEGYDNININNHWFGDGLLRLVDVPFILFNQFLNFDILGINFYYLLLGLFTLFIVFWLFRKFTGK